MGFFSRLFGKDTIKMVDVENVSKEGPFKEKKEGDEAKKTNEQSEKNNNEEKSPFFDSNQ